jgi:hypothetical protein
MDLKFKINMKKIFITTAMIGLLGTSVFAADGTKKATKAATVSYTVENQFDAAFNNAKDVAWTITSNCQKATFTDNGVKKSAFYNLQGEYLGLTQDVTYAVIDPKAKATIADKYKDYSVKQVIELQSIPADASFEETNYFVDLKNDNSEVLVRVSSGADVYFFKQVK